MEEILFVIPILIVALTIMPLNFNLLREKISSHNKTAQENSKNALLGETSAFGNPVPKRFSSNNIDAAAKEKMHHNLLQSRRDKMASRNLVTFLIILISSITFQIIKTAENDQCLIPKSIHERKPSFYKVELITTPVVTTTPAPTEPTTTPKPKKGVDRDALLWNVMSDISLAISGVSANVDGEEDYVPRKATILDIDGKYHKNQNLTITDNLICCYIDPSSRDNRNLSNSTSNSKNGGPNISKVEVSDSKTLRMGRPFIRNEGIDKYWTEYMQNTDAVIHSRKQKIELVPQLVTGVSENHWTEHRQHMGQIKKLYPGQKVVIYDLGLSADQIEYIRNHEDFYIYEVFDFLKYGWHTMDLQNFAWKMMIWMETLQKYQAIQYFDSSIWLRKNSTDAINEKIVKLDSCWIYYIKKAGHDITSHTHPTMLSYFPSDWSRMMSTDENYYMFMAGAVIIYNTPYCKNNILKFAFLCALTPDCIAPHGSMKGCARPNWWMYDMKQYADRDEMTYLTVDKMTRNWAPHIYQICHRFDQALMTILWANQLRNNFTSIFIENNEVNLRFASLVRSHENKLSVDAHGRIIKMLGDGRVVDYDEDQTAEDAVEMEAEFESLMAGYSKSN